jgi:hypothetical protein
VAFRDFTFPNVVHELDLTLASADLFGSVAPLEVSAEFLERMRFNSDLGVRVHTEKARSEFIIAPILLELTFRYRDRFGLFSGVTLDVDASRGLNGVCDFVLTRSPLQDVVTAPLLAIVEAKNDSIPTGLGQCIASTVAAREYNLMEKRPPAPVFGAVTTGSTWRFLRLDGAALTLDKGEYYISEPGRILGILASIVA